MVRSKNLSNTRPFAHVLHRPCARTHVVKYFFPSQLDSEQFSSKAQQNFSVPKCQSASLPSDGFNGCRTLSWTRRGHLVSCCACNVCQTAKRNQHRRRGDRTEANVLSCKRRSETQDGRRGGPFARGPIGQRSHHERNRYIGNESYRRHASQVEFSESSGLCFAIGSRDHSVHPTHFTYGNPTYSHIGVTYRQTFSPVRPSNATGQQLETLVKIRLRSGSEETKRETISRGLSNVTHADDIGLISDLAGDNACVFLYFKTK